MSEKNANLTNRSPFHLRLGAFLNERFPPLQYGILIVSYYSSNQFLARVLTTPGEPMRYDLGSLLGAVTMLCLFFQLRVFDEHKDFDADSRHYPERVLQRGLITLRHLKILGGIAIAIEVLFATLWNPAGNFAPLVSLMIVMAFSLLMLKEFFVREWLRKHFLVYAAVHMLIMPLLALVIYSFATGRYPWQADPWFCLYAMVGFFVTFNWEIARKIRAPDDEIEGVQSYTKVFGQYGAANAVLVMRVIDTALVAVVGYHLKLSGIFYITLAALFVLCLVGYFQFRWYPSTKTAKRMETYAGMYIIAFDAILALELGRTYGVEYVWS